MKLTHDQDRIIRESSLNETAYNNILRALLVETTTTEYQKKIIIVDDEATVSSFVRLVLEQQGYHTSIASSGVDCLELLRAESPNLILMDISMPNMDGSELFSRVRATEHGAKVPVIFITGLISADEEADFNKTRSDRKSYLGKPFTPQKLLSAVRDMIG